MLGTMRLNEGFSHMPIENRGGRLRKRFKRDGERGNAVSSLSRLCCAAHAYLSNEDHSMKYVAHGALLCTEETPDDQEQKHKMT